MSIITDEFVSKVGSIMHPQKFYRRIDARTTAFNVTDTSTPDSYIDIVAEPHYISDGYVCFDATIPGNAGDFTGTFLSPFVYNSGLRLYVEQNSTPIIDFSAGLHNYCRSVVPRELSEEEFLSFDVVGNYATAAAQQTINYGFSPKKTDGYQVTTNNVTAGAALDTLRPLELAYCITSGANATNLTLRCRFKLSLIKNTLLSMGKCLYFAGKKATLQLLWAPSSKSIFKCDDKDLAIADAAAFTYAGKNIAIANLHLFIPFEQNQQIKDMMIGYVDRGIKYTVPQVFVSSYPLAAGLNSVNIPYNIGHGQALQKVYWNCYNANEGDGSGQDINNVYSDTQARVLSYQTRLNQIPLQDSRQVLYTRDDYLLQKDNLKGSLLNNALIFYRNWSHCDDFTRGSSPLEKDKYAYNLPDVNIYDGVSLTKDQTYNISVTTGFACTLYVYAVVLRDLTIDKNGVRFEPHNSIQMMKN